MKTYVGDAAQAPFVWVLEPPAPPRPLPIVPYPYELEQPPAPTLLAWWQGHDAAIRLAASLLVDACGVDIDPYGREVLVTPAHLARFGQPVEPVPTYLARALAEAVVSTFAPDQFVITDEALHAWAQGLPPPQQS
jgi:hypothetical protein